MKTFLIFLCGVLGIGGIFLAVLFFQYRKKLDIKGQIITLSESFLCIVMSIIFIIHLLN